MSRLVPTIAAHVYPGRPEERDRWVLAQRSERNTVDPRRPYAFFREEERTDSGEVVSGAAVFLTNRECPWRCVMCDLWKNTLTEVAPSGAIPEQIDFALRELRRTAARTLPSQPESQNSISSDSVTK